MSLATYGEVSDELVDKLIKKKSTRSSSIWLDLESGAPGLPGPYLQEFNDAYQQLDTYILTETRPNLVLVVGGKAKRQQLADSFELICDKGERGTIYLRLLDQSKALLAIDYELHLKGNLSRILGGPCPGHHINHCLAGAPTSPSLIATRLYSEILAPFYAAAILFVADFCGLENATELLAAWLQNAILRPSDTGNIGSLRVLLVLNGTQRTSTPSLDHLWFQITLKLLRKLRSVDCAQFPIFSDLRRKGPEHMSLKILPELSDRAFAEAVIAKLPEPASTSFKALHLQSLLKAAIRHFSRSASDAFNPILASRARLSLPLGWQHNVLEFIRCTKHTDIRQISFIASALALNSFPPEIHRI